MVVMKLKQKNNKAWKQRQQKKHLLSTKHAILWSGTVYYGTMVLRRGIMTVCQINMHEITDIANYYVRSF